MSLRQQRRAPARAWKSSGRANGIRRPFSKSEARATGFIISATAPIGMNGLMLRAYGSQPQASSLRAVVGVSQNHPRACELKSSTHLLRAMRIQRTLAEERFDPRSHTKRHEIIYLLPCRFVWLRG